MSKLRSILAAGFVSTVGLAAFASVGAAQDVNLTFRFNDPEAEEMRAALDEFEKANPGIKVELQRIAWTDARQQFLREAAVGEGPDVVHIAFVWPRDMGTAGALLPLNDLLEQQPIHGGFDDFIATELSKDNEGNIYGIPWTTDTWAMVYRTDLLDEAGVGAIPSTWAELHDASKTIHDKIGKVGFGFPAGSASSGTIWFLANYYWWSNGDALVVEASGGGYTTGITVEKIVDAMKYYHAYLQEGHSPESMLGISNWFDPVIMEALVTGDQAIAIMPPQQFKEIIANYEQRNPGAEPPFVTATTPGGPEGPKTHLGGRMLGINANTEHPEAAWKLVEFLTREKIFIDYYSNQFPAQKSLLKNIDFGPLLGGFAEQLTLARPWGAYADSPAQIGVMWNDAGRAFGSAFIGEKTYEEAAAELLKSVEDQLK